jgi:hypothetical protein
MNQKLVLLLLIATIAVNLTTCTFTINDTALLEWQHDFFSRMHQRQAAALAASLESFHDPPPPPLVFNSRAFDGSGSLLMSPLAYISDSFGQVWTLARAIVLHVCRVLANILAQVLWVFFHTLGFLTVHTGRTLDALGGHQAGYSLEDYGIGFLSFGETLRFWFGQKFLEGDSFYSDFPNMAAYWNEFGRSFVATRNQVENYYAHHEQDNAHHEQDPHHVQDNVPKRKEDPVTKK